MKEIKLKSENLELYYGDFKALNSINLEFYTNTVTALIGPSGCGKSTYLRCINRMNDLLPNVKINGTITLDDMNIYDKKMEVVDLRKKVGMVFQKLIRFQNQYLKMWHMA